jgi:flagellar basal body P-ring formation protein FlgA
VGIAFNLRLNLQLMIAMYLRPILSLCPPLGTYSYFALMIFMMFFNQIASASMHTQETFYAPEELAQLVREYVQTLHASSAGELQIKLSVLDARLKLNRCEQPLKLEILNPSAHQLGRTSIQIKCDGPKAWKIYQPVEINLWQPIVVFAQPLKKGIAIQPEHIRLERRNLSLLPKGHFSQTQDVLQLVTQHNVRTGQVASLSNLGAQKLVKRGQLIRIINNRQGIKIESKGYALTDGVQGEQIRVKHADTGKIFTVQITGTATAMISVSLPP